MKYQPRYVRFSEVELQGYTYSNQIGSVADRINTSSYCFNLRLVMISWYNRKKRSLVLISKEVQYMETSLVNFEAIWLHNMLTRLFCLERWPTVTHSDNQSCIKLSKNHDRSKHSQIRYHLIRDKVQRGTVRLQYISRDMQVADSYQASTKEVVSVLQRQAGGGGESLPFSEGVFILQHHNVF